MHQQRPRPERIAWVLGTSPGRRSGVFLAELLHDPLGISCALGVCGQKKTLGCYRLIPVAQQSVEIAGLECSLFDLLSTAVPNSRGLTGPLSSPVPLIRVTPKGGQGLELIANGKIAAAVKLWSRIDAETNASISSVIPFFTNNVQTALLPPKLLSQHFHDMFDGADEAGMVALRNAYFWAIDWKAGRAPVEIFGTCKGSCVRELVSA